jgi:hypothetical protein
MNITYYDPESEKILIGMINTIINAVEYTGLFDKIINWFDKSNEIKYNINNDEQYDINVICVLK